LSKTFQMKCGKIIMSYNMNINRYKEKSCVLTIREKNLKNIQ
jgi:hypothetical protein